MIKVKDIYKTFNAATPLENHVLNGLSLEIKQGEFVTIIGSNGAGKSTFLNALSGEIIADSGSVWIGDKNVTAMNTEKRAGLVARVFQDPLAGTCANLSIQENLALAFKRGERRGISPAVKQQYQGIFKQRLQALNLGLEKRLTDKMGLLSGGQRQAVSLLMASLKPSQVLLLDEHTAALDPKTADYVLNLTQQIVKEQQLTTIMVTHSMRQALDYGDRTVMLHQGKVIFDVDGEQRKKMDIPDLLDLFQKASHSTADNDALLLD